MHLLRRYHPLYKYVTLGFVVIALIGLYCLFHIQKTLKDILVVKVKI